MGAQVECAKWGSLSFTHPRPGLGSRCSVGRIHQLTLEHSTELVLLGITEQLAPPGAAPTATVSLPHQNLR